MLHDQTSHINGNLLADLTGRALEAYPAHATSIRLARELVLQGAVTLAGHTAFVESGTVRLRGVYYRVEGPSCSCPASGEYCSHRFAVALLRKLMAAEAMPPVEAVDAPKRYYAWLNGQTELAGEAEEAGDGGYVFFFRGEPLATTVPADMLTLLGEVRLSDAQRAIDGDYVAKVVGRG